MKLQQAESEQQFYNKSQFFIVLLDLLSCRPLLSVSPTL